MSLLTADSALYVWFTRLRRCVGTPSATCTSFTGSERRSAMTSLLSGSATATVSAPSAKTSGSTSWRCASGGSIERGRGRLRRRVAKVDDRNVELLAERAGDVFFADHAALDEERAEPLPVRVL